ncbi:ABC transporter permease [Paracoccus suum]|uniref:ABC transporter permease n=1 Tax=Paracoccus suum TaxID=2259340 RepID=A0A344PMD1_9RHOB|nr:ABC transporter permease [Paracoccus suum]AXC50536.1 ABC transporter permease [Paracoccus suum]
MSSNPVILEDTAPSDAQPARFSVPAPAITTASILIVLLLWEYFGRNVNPLFGSYPTAIARELVVMAKEGTLWKAGWESTRPMAAGFLLALVMGIPFGLLLGRFRWVEAAFGIYVTAGYAMPLIALVPLLVLWFGLGFAVKTAIVTLLTFFPICINTWIGVKSVPRSLLEVGKSFVASPFTILTRIVLPAVVPYIMAGIRLAIGKAVIAIIVAEFFTAVSGLGGVILTASNNFETARMLAPIIVIMAGAVIATAAVGWLERRIAPWHVEISGRGVQ